MELAVSTRRRARGRDSARSRAHPAVLASVALTLGLSLLPLLYLAVRAAGVEGDAIAILTRPRTLEILGGTLALTGTVALGSAALGAPLAWLTARTDLPMRKAWTALVLVPIAIPSYVMAFACVSAFGPRGALQGLLEPFGVVELPSLYGFPGAALVLILATYPYVLLATRAGLARGDRRLEEAARSLGDTRATHFRRVTLPLVAPAITAGMLLSVLYTLSDFGAVAILRFDSLARAVYLQYQASFDRQVAALLALVLIGIALAVTLCEATLRRRAIHEAATSGAPEPVRLGRWRWPAVALCAAVVIVALVIPLVTITWWLARGLLNGEPLALLADAAASTLLAGAVAAILAVVLAIPVASLAMRRPSRLVRLAETGVSIPYAMPGIALALGVVFLAANAVPFAYQTLGLLIVVYAMRFLPEAVAPIRVSLGGLSPRLPEAARALGRTSWGAFWSVTLPALRPGLFGAAALVFLTTVKELPLTLVLSPIGFETLATAIWGAASEGFYARAAAPALLLIALSTASLGLLLRHEERRP